MLGDCSVRVSNELGAAHPRVAKFSVFVVNGTSILISIIFCAIVLIFRVGLSKLFTSDSEVIEDVSSLTPLLAISVFLNGIQPILSGNKVISIRIIFGLSRPPILTFVYLPMENFRSCNWKWVASDSGLCKLGFLLCHWSHSWLCSWL